MTINKFVKIIQFNVVNYTFFNSHISNLSHYVWFYVNQFSKELTVKTLIENNIKHVINFEKKNSHLFNWFIINL